MADAKNHGMRLGYEAVTIDGIALDARLFDENGDVLEGRGATVPTTAKRGFAPGCDFIDTGTGLRHTNVGSKTSCRFLPRATGRRKQYCILKPEVGTDVVVATEDISGGGDVDGSIARAILDYPRNLLYTLVDNASDTLEAIFVVEGLDQFGEAVTETVTVDYDGSATEAGTQIFSEITSVTITPTNEAASDTASVGVAIAADVASFGLPDELTAVTQVKAVNWIDSGVGKTQNIDSTSVVVARSCFRPEQTVAAADDYIIDYEVA